MNENLLKQLLRPLLSQVDVVLPADIAAFLNEHLDTLTISKLLGSAIVVGGGLVKLPQLLKILLSGSAQGLSLPGYLLETLAYAIALSYNYRNKNPFSTYGETLFITVQNCAIMLLMLVFRRQIVSLVGLGCLGAAATWALFQAEIVREDVLTMLQVSTIPISLLSKLPQIVTNYRNSSTGQLSAITVFAFLAGSLARVYTTMKDVQDPVILYGFVSASVLNAALALQMLWYWNGGKDQLKKMNKNKKE